MLDLQVQPYFKSIMLHDGFYAYNVRRTHKRSGIELVVAENGVLWGRFENIPEPRLIPSPDSKVDCGIYWLETVDDYVLLKIEGTQFCLVSRCTLKEEALEVAHRYLGQDIEVGIKARFERRAGIQTFFNHAVHHDALVVASTELMVKALRPPEGIIPMLWVASPASEKPVMNINEIHPIVLAWSKIDIHIAEKLLRCVFQLQTGSGAIPVSVTPDGTTLTLEAPKPLLAKTAELIWNRRKDKQLLDELIPPLRRYLQWTLRHFDPRQRGLHCWKNRSEPIVPHVYENDLATADLTALLLAETEAFNRLCLSSEAFGEYAEAFNKDIEIMKNNMENIFWNAEEEGYVNALCHDRPMLLHGLSSFFPLLWRDLPHAARNKLLEKMRISGVFPGNISIMVWRKTSLDDLSFPALQNILILWALLTADPHGGLVADFARLTLNGFAEWYTLALADKTWVQINPLAAAYVVIVNGALQDQYRIGSGPLTRMVRHLRKAKIDRFDFSIAAATAALILGVRIFYSALAPPPPYPVLEAEMNIAYANFDVTNVLKSYNAIVQHYSEHADSAKMLVANMAMRGDRPEQALALYEEIRAGYPDSPGPMVAHGLALQLQKRFSEADQIYIEFCFLFDVIFPEVVEQVSSFKSLIQEGFSSPPNWKSIYRYKIMHEI